MTYGSTSLLPAKGLAPPGALVLCLLLTSPLTSPAAEIPVPRDRRAAPLSQVQGLALTSLDLGVLAAEDELRQANGEPWRYAVPRRVLVTPDSGGSWQKLDAETLLWRLRVSAPGARSLSFGFTRYHLPAGARLLIYAADESDFVRPFTEDDNRDHGELWTPHLATDEVVLELSVPETLASLVELEVGYVSHGYRGFHRGVAVGDPESLAARSGSCNVDVVCPEGNAWRRQIRSVALLTVQGSTLCTGVLLNNTAGDLRPLLLTANHCRITGATERSVVVYWNVQNSSCRAPGSPESGRGGNGSRNRFQSGSTLRASWSETDFSLIELDRPPEPSWNVYWAGWDAGGAAPASAVGIHHPRGEEKRISFENDRLSVTSFLSTVSPGNGRFLRVEDWDLGTTEPGSSGSPLFDARRRVVGQLTGGSAACGNDRSDWYGRFAASWDGGGNPSTRLRDWLDPSASGRRSLDGADRPAEQPLEAPSELTGVAVSATRVELSWRDNSTRERDFLVQMRLAGEGRFATLGTSPANSTSFLVEGLTPATEYVFRIRARRGELKSPFTAGVAVTTPAAAPERPSGLEAIATSASEIRLTWSDRSVNEEEFRVEVSEDGQTFVRAAALPADSTTATLGGLPALAHRYFRVNAVSGGGASPFSNTAQATTDGPVGPCIADGVNLCLGGGRFRVSARWTDGRGVSDTARARAITGDTGYLWFFSPANVELAVKVLEGCPSNGHYWVFSTGLTNVAVVLQALDTVTGKARTYVNPLRTPYRPVLDNEAFDTCP